MSNPDKAKEDAERNKFESMYQYQTHNSIEEIMSMPDPDIVITKDELGEAQIITQPGNTRPITYDRMKEL